MRPQFADFVAERADEYDAEKITSLHSIQDLFEEFRR